MDDEVRQKRQTEIFSAAYELLAKHGYGGTSMLRIAKAAKASNETLYRWYGDKDGLFKDMVRANAAETRKMLGDALDCGDDPWATLEVVAPVFLQMILGQKAILLNRAAAADPTGALGASISFGGRNEVMPLLNQLMERICDGTDCNPKDAADWLVSLLVGDLQIRRIIHDRDPLSEQEIGKRCSNILNVLRQLIEGRGHSKTGLV